MTSINIAVDELNILLQSVISCLENIPITSYMFPNLEECIKNIKEKEGVVQLIKKCYNDKKFGKWLKVNQGAELLGSSPEKSITVRGSHGSMNISTCPPEIEIMRFENVKFKEKEEKRKEKVKKLEEEKSLFNVKNIEMKMKISALKSEITKISQESHKNIEIETEILKRNYKEKYDDEFKRFNLKKEELIKDNENLKSENKKKTEEINVITDENDQLIVENKRLAYEKDELSVQLDSKSKEFNKIIKDLEVERSDLNLKVEKLESRITELEEVVKCLNEPTVGHGETLESLNNFESSFN